MSTSKGQIKKSAPSDGEDNALFSDSFDAVRDAVERLYIRNNLSGRLLFMKNWPHVARSIFSEELRHFDDVGAVTDGEKERRAQLEDEAEERRDSFAFTFEIIDRELMKDGSVQLDVLEGIMQRYDREMCLLLFTPRFVDRYHPPPEADKPEEKEKADQGNQEHNGSEETKRRDPEAYTRDTEEQSTGRVNIPPPADHVGEPMREYKDTDRKKTEETYKNSRKAEHIGHADHSLSQSLTKNQYEETDLFNDTYQDDMDNIMPIELGDGSGRVKYTQDEGPDSPPEEGQEPQTPSQEEEQTSPVLPVVNREQPPASEASSAPPLPPEDEEEDKPLFVADAERHQRGDASAHPQSDPPQDDRKDVPPLPSEDEEQDKPLFVADIDKERDPEAHDNPDQPDNIFKPVQTDKRSSED